MNIKQLSVFVENKCGSAYSIASTLSENNINISALSIADTTEYGIMRLIVDNPEKAKALLQEGGIMVKITDVVAIPMSNNPGALTTILEKLSAADISVKYMYAFVNKTNSGAVLVTKTNDNDLTVAALKEIGITPISQEELL